MDDDKMFFGAGCVILFVWLIGVLVSLGVSAAIIYFLIQAANGNVF